MINNFILGDADDALIYEGSRNSIVCCQIDFDLELADGFEL